MNVRKGDLYQEFGRRADISRRRFLYLSAAGAATFLAGCSSTNSSKSPHGTTVERTASKSRTSPAPDAADQPSRGPVADHLSLDTGWRFGEYVPGALRPDFNDGGFEPVTLPHIVTELSWHKWDPNSWDKVWAYRRSFDAPRDLSGLRVFLDFAGVLTGAAVVLNGKKLGEHLGGYVPFGYEITDHLKPRNNVLAVKVDSRWGLNVPPNRPEPSHPTSVDFWQPGGIYRDVSLKIMPQAYVKGVFARPVDVLDPSKRRVEVSCAVDAASALSGPARLDVELRSGGAVVSRASAPVKMKSRGEKVVRLTLKSLGNVKLWDLENPNLYDVAATLTAGGQPPHACRSRVGFRQATFRESGFYLNGKRVKVFGLNRHQFYPYAGAAMGARVQRKDAEILKNDLNCNMVRCSHYPQSEAFLDACDELGLLVWEEAPGWDYVGDREWRSYVFRDVRAMILRDRNRPSVVLWGTRLNETKDHPELYKKTRNLAKKLDSLRQTTGAVKRTPLIGGGEKNLGHGKEYDPYSTTEYVQDVFSFNDYDKLFLFRGDLPTLRPPRLDFPYLISEAVGTLIGPRTFRRTDRLEVQEAQSIYHASVHNVARSDDRYCGLLAWSAFDYPSAQGHARDGVKWTGVADIFRVPKIGAAFYRSQVDPAVRPVIEPAFYWDFSRKSPPNGPGKGTAIWSNCERLELFAGGKRVKSPRLDRRRFPNLRYPPFLTDLTTDGAKRPELRIDGYVGGRPVVSRRFSSDASKDRLAMAADDAELAADGRDATRVVFRALDRYGVPRPYVKGDVTLKLEGPGTLVGDSPFAFEAAGGVGAVWVRTLPGREGEIRLRARHRALGSASVSIAARRA